MSVSYTHLDVYKRQSIRWRFIIIFIAIAIVAFAVVLMLTSRIVEENLLSQRVSEGVRQITDFSVGAAPYYTAQNADALYQMAVEMGREINGRVLLLNEAGVVQVDSFSMLNGTKLRGREVVEVLSGQKDSSYGYHRCV